MAVSRSCKSVCQMDIHTTETCLLFETHIYLTHYHTRKIVVNGNDRVLRVFSLEEEDNGSFILEPGNKFQDLVNRIQWKQCHFSPNGDYVVGGGVPVFKVCSVVHIHTQCRTNLLGSGSPATHNIYIWDSENGSFVKMLEGPREDLYDFAVSISIKR
jgi:COMPASS component SWD1